ncbi:hypothetical protein U0C78_12560, partial [Enterococcus durans]
LESSYEFVGQINSKGFQGVFSIFFYTKKMLAKFTNIKKYRAFFSDFCPTLINYRATSSKLFCCFKITYTLLL